MVIRTGLYWRHQTVLVLITRYTHLIRKSNKHEGMAWPDVQIIRVQGKLLFPDFMAFGWNVEL
jgi:hypothetical protein